MAEALLFDIDNVSPLGSNAQIEIRRLEELRPHPSYSRHGLSVSAAQLSALEAIGNQAFEEPIAITQDGLIIDGYARVRLARLRGRKEIRCLIYERTSEEALRDLLQRHRGSNRLNAFCRTVLALDLEPGLKEQARANQRAGGHLQGLQKLAKASAIHVRAEIAAVADVCGWNVDKVKYLRAHTTADLQEAVRDGELSIHRAWLWCKQPMCPQSEMLRRYRLNKGILRSATQRASRRRQQIQSVTRVTQVLPQDYLNSFLKHLCEAVRSGTVVIKAIDDPGQEIFVPQHLLEAFRTRGKVNPDAA